jgi:flagellar hook-basal body complex protein FliE
MMINVGNQISDISFMPTGQPREAAQEGKVFEQFYNSALEVLNETNQQQITADNLQLDFATGRTNNILTVIMAQEQASTSLNFTVQVTNRMLESYREIIRLSV